jgi:hypothetical protein
MKESQAEPQGSVAQTTAPPTGGRAFALAAAFLCVFRSAEKD